MTTTNNNTRTQLVDFSIFKKDVLEAIKLKNAKRQFKALYGKNYKGTVQSLSN